MNEQGLENRVRDLEERVERLELANRALLEHLMSSSRAESNDRRTWAESAVRNLEDAQRLMETLLAAPQSPSIRVGPSVQPFLPQQVASDPQRAQFGQVGPTARAQHPGQDSKRIVLSSQNSAGGSNAPAQSVRGTPGDMTRSAQQTVAQSEAALVSLTRAWQAPVDPFSDAQGARFDSLKVELTRQGYPGPFAVVRNVLFGAYSQLDIPARRLTLIVPVGEILGTTTPKADKLLTLADGSAVVPGIRYRLHTLGVLREPVATDDEFHAGLVKRKCCVAPI